MQGIDVLAEQLGRFAFRLAGAHVSDTSPKSTNRNLAAKRARHVPRAHLQRKEYLDEHGHCEVV
jgi:hypothetical protein